MLHTFRYELYVIKLFESTIKYWKCNDVTLLTWQWVQDQAFNVLSSFAKTLVVVDIWK